MPNTKEKTTAMLHATTLAKIKELKLHPRETVEDVILRLIDFWCGAEKLELDGKKR